MRSRITLDKLNSLKSVQFEDWPKHGVRLRAVSANASGVVNSGMLQDKRFFYRKWSADFKSSWFEWVTLP